MGQMNNVVLTESNLHKNVSGTDVGMSPSTLLWYGLRCLTGKESEATKEIEGIGLEVCPLTYRVKTWPRKKRKSVIVERHLCPGYVFARVPRNRWSEVRRCLHVIGWVCDDRGPLAMRRPDHLNKLYNASIAGAYDDADLEGRLRRGDELEVLFGPFSGWRVSFMALKGSSVEGELAMMGAPRRVLIPAENLRMKRDKG